MEPVELEELEGTYRVTAWEFPVVVEARGGRLWLRFPSGEPQELIPTGRQDWFVNLESGDDVVFSRDGDGRATEVQIGRAMRAVREKG